MKKDFLPYQKMKEIFVETTGRDPITWGVGTGKLWVIRLAFNSGFRKRDFTKDHFAVAYHKADKGIIMELLYMLQCVDLEGTVNSQTVGCLV